MRIKDKKVKISIFVILCLLINFTSYVYIVGAEENLLEFIIESEHATDQNQKVAYITFDDGPSIYTEKLLDVLNEHEVPGIFFVLGSQFDFIPNFDVILNRIIDDGHYIALHTMTHDKNVLYRSEKSPATFTEEMFTLRDEVAQLTGHVSNLCRAPYGKKGHFKVAHYKSVEEAGLYCIDWHVDSQDWAKQNAAQIYDEVIQGLEEFEDNDEIVLLFHEYQRTVDALPDIINHLKEQGYTFKPYVEGKTFQGLE